MTNLKDIFTIMEEEEVEVTTAEQTNPVKDLPLEFQKMEFVPINE